MRATVETMALVLGGLQSLTVNTWQEAYEIPDQEAMLTALRTQQVVAYESGVADTADPLAGSYFVESLTDEYERRILALMAEVKERGGMARGIESGWVQQQVLEEAYRHSMAVESGERLIVGENIFQSADEPPPTRLYQHDPAVLEEQVRRLREVRARRDGAAVGRALDALRSSCGMSSAPSRSRSTSLDRGRGGGPAERFGVWVAQMQGAAEHHRKRIG